MPKSCVQNFTDPDEYRTSLRAAGIDLVVTCQGHFRAGLTYAEVRQLHLLRCQEELPRIAFASLAPELAFVTFPTSRSPAIISGGVELRRGEFMFHGRGERFHQCVIGESHWGAIALAPEQLATYGRALTGMDVAPPPFGQVLRPPRPAVTRLLRLHAQASRLAETSPHVIAHPEVGRALQEEMIHALIECLTADHAPAASAAMRRHAEIMIRLEQVLTAHHDRLMPISKLSSAVNVSERSLRLCCAQFLGMTPSRYLRLRRLNLVRAAIRHADPATASVAELAKQHGFTELGRFAAFYWAIFGEMPSVTLRCLGSRSALAKSA